MGIKKTNLNSYTASGVNYNLMDPIKRLAQVNAVTTSMNLERFNMHEVKASRGESAYVWEERDAFRAIVIEGLGTKNLIADQTRAITGRSHYDDIAQDTVAMIVNDLIIVGADPQVVNAYFGIGSSAWLTDKERTSDLVHGWALACNKAGAVWGGGETPTLKDVIDPNTIDLAGSAIGIIKPKERLILGDALTPGDEILLIESSGIHANGITLARTIASKLSDGYKTLLSDGKSFGESLLVPTHIYASFVRDLFNQGIEIHYMVNITGHGWRKLMRANKNLSYVIDQIPKPHEVFKFIQKHSGISDKEMYGNFNMGAGFAIFMPSSFTQKAIEIGLKNHGLNCLVAGQVENGPKKVVILPKKLIYDSATLEIR